MADAGLFESQRVELIGGEVFEMAPQHNLHAVAIGLVDQALRDAFGDGFWVRCQLPLTLISGSEPEPDFAVVKGQPRDFKGAATTEHPNTAPLVVEISESTLAHDARRKASLYAAAGIEDYWIVNLEDMVLMVHRNPVADASEEFSFRYGDVKTLQSDDTISPLAQPQAQIKVVDLLP